MLLLSDWSPETKGRRSSEHEAYHHILLLQEKKKVKENKWQLGNWRRNEKASKWVYVTLGLYWGALG